MSRPHLLRAFVASFITVLSALSLAAPAAYAATYTCTWTGSGADHNFSTAGNWTGCNGGAPSASDADDLVFPTDTATNFTPNNDLTGAIFNSITFSGTGGSTAFTLSGNAFTLAGNITDSSDQNNVINNAFTLSTDTTITIAGSDQLSLDGAVSGTGAITKAGTGLVRIISAQSTGSLTVNAGNLSVRTSSGSTPFSGVTIASGATFADDIFDSGSGPFTFDKPINGAGTFDLSTVGSGGNFSLDVTGDIALTGDMTFTGSDNVTVNLKGAISGAGFKVLAGTGITIVNQSTNNTSATPGGVLPGSSSNASDTSAKTPDTGFALVAAHPLVTLGVTTVLAAGIALASRRLAFAKVPVRRR